MLVANYLVKNNVRSKLEWADADAHFASLGAVSYHDDLYPGRRSLYTGEYTPGREFSRHYFNSDGLEIGYYLYDLSTIHELEKLRAWGFPRNLMPLEAKCS